MNIPISTTGGIPYRWSSAGPTIVVADDDKDDLFFFEDAFKGLHRAATIICVESGEMLMQTLKRLPVPHAVFLDINMPRKNGEQYLMEIKRDPALKAMPIFMLSTSIGPAKQKLLLEAGALACYQKPTERATFIALLHDALVLAGLEEKLPITACNENTRNPQKDSLQ